MFEWLQSPIIYWNSNDFRNTFAKIMVEYFNPRSTINHYLGLSKRTFLDFAECKEVKLKKYFYILRPLLAARWINRKNCIPPMDFDSLLEASDLDKSVLALILDVKKKKEQCNETQLVPRLIELESFINSEMHHLEVHLPDDIKNDKKISLLNDIFLREIMGN
jgi:uncharacterized protein